MINGIIYDTMEITSSKAYIGPRNYFYVDINWTAQDADGKEYQDTLTMWYDNFQNLWRRTKTILPDEVIAAVASLWAQNIEQCQDIRG